MDSMWHNIDLTTSRGAQLTGEEEWIRQQDPQEAEEVLSLEEE
jgi:hypothetical protein